MATRAAVNNLSVNERKEVLTDLLGDEIQPVSLAALKGVWKNIPRTG